MQPNPVQQCVNKSYTPDAASMRYSGPQRVFLWDLTGDREGMQRLGLETFKDYETEYFTSYTDANYLPFRQKGTNSFYLPVASNWANTVKFDADDSFSGAPRQVKGRVLKVGLKALRKLDQHYANGIVTFRRKITIRPNDMTNKDSYQAWAYFTVSSTLTKWDPHTNVYYLPRGFEVENITRLDINKNTCYTIGGATWIKEN